MRLSDLLRMEARGPGGEDLGNVDDVRLEVVVPPGAPGGPRWRVSGFIVGHGDVGRRLGYGRGSVGGPWLLRVLMERLARSARYVPWAEVSSLDRGELLVPLGEEALVPMEQADVRSGGD